MIAKVVVFLLLGVWGVWLIMTGSLPLEDGAQIADGAITIVRDDSAMMPVAAHLFRLEDGGFGLVDAALDAEAANIRATLARIGKTDSDIRVILFTHGHGDHTRGARAFPNAEAQLELRALAERLRPRRNEIRYLAFGHQGPLERLDPLLQWAGLE
jgi:glyoxylase-like metal-dependent hydrolase (beta-lactamase superfamily II)